MRVWTLANGSMVALGALAMLVSGPVTVSGQTRTFVITTADSGQRDTTVRSHGPVLQRDTDGQARPRLGVSVRDVGAEDVASLKLAAPAGVVILKVEPGSPAEAAGLLTNDVISTYDAEPVRSVAQFTRLVGESVAGRAVKLGITRAGKKVEVAATPMRSRGRDIQVWRDRSEADGDGETPFFGLSPNGPIWLGRERDGLFGLTEGRPKLGVTVQDLSDELAEFFGVKEGALVSTVVKDSPAAKAGIKAGDVITTIDNTPIDSADALVRAIREQSGDLAVGVVRDKQKLSLKATIEKRTPPKSRTTTRGVEG